MPGELLVGVRGAGHSPRQIARLEAVAGRVAGYHPALGVYRLTLRPGLSLEDALARLRRLPEVRFAEPNYIFRLGATPNDTHYSTKQYGPQKVQADLAWEIWQPQARAVIAIVDTGTDVNHPDLTNKIFRDGGGQVIGYDFANNDSDPQDDHGHGTHTTGIAAAQINNSLGIAGIAGWNGQPASSDTTFVKIMPVKVLNSSGRGSAATVADGITFAADQGAKVISLSLGSTEDSATVRDAVQYAWNKDCVIVAAAGNEGSAARLYPAAYPNVISVGATDETDTLTSFSNYGAWVKIAAPGSAIYSTTPTVGGGYPNNYAELSGTSMSTPHVAGAAALIRAQNPILSNSEVSALLTFIVDPYAAHGGRTLGPGAGRLNVYRALAAAGDGTATLAAVNVNPTVVAGGNPVTGLVTLGGPAPSGGVTVTLSSSDTAFVEVPASVTIAAGATSTTFPITTGLVPAQTSFTITATQGAVAKTARLMLTPLLPVSLTLKPTTVVGGRPTIGTVTLNGPAPTGGAVVSLTSSNTAAATVPATVTIPADKNAVTFKVTTKGVAAASVVTISAIFNGETKSAKLTVKPAALSKVAFKPGSVVGGKNTVGKALLNGEAPPGGAVVTLSSANTGVVTVPASVTINAGANSATFTASTNPVAVSTAVNVSGTYRGVTRTGKLTVNPPSLISLTLNPTSVTGGGSSTGTVTLNGPAPTGGITVALSSSNAVVAQVPMTVAVPAGATSAQFTVTTRTVNAATSVKITASHSGINKTATLRIMP